MIKREKIIDEARRLHNKKMSAMDISMMTGLTFKEVIRIIEVEENKKFSNRKCNEDTN